MAGLASSNATYDLWDATVWGDIIIACQEDVHPRRGFNGLFSNPSYIINSTRTLWLFQFSLILSAVCATSFLLKPFGFPILSQLAGGILVMGLLFPKEMGPAHELLPEPILYILKTISNLGLALHTFMLGVETNMGILRKIGKKSLTICFSGFGSSLLLSTIVYKIVTANLPGYLPPNSWRLFVHLAFAMFGVTINNVNDLGISNSELGRLALSVSLIIDVFSMFASFILFNVFLPFLGRQYYQPLWVLGDYVFMFFFLRPILICLVSYTPEGNRMSQTHFMGVMVIVFAASMGGALVSQKFSVFLFALSIPPEPLSTILTEKLDAITSGFFFPIFCAVQGLEANFWSLKDLKKTVALEILLITAQIGKLIGTYFSSILFSIPWQTAISLAIIINSKGLFDIILMNAWCETGDINAHMYTLTTLHMLVTSFAFLPMVRKLYEPSKHYATIFRQNVASSSEVGSSLQTLVCVHDEETVPGVLQFLETLHPSRSNPIPVVVIQLIQLTGRCSLPIMAPWDQVKSYAVLKSNISRGNRIVNAFSNLERKLKGYFRVQHYVSVASYATMHNDICNLAYEKNTSLIILPFHVRWTIDGKVEDTSPAIREVNNMVFSKAPCTVATFINRGDRDLTQLQLHLPNNDMYRVTIFFLEGLDDEEALAFCNFFANHPFITLTLIWLNSGQPKDRNSREYQVIEKTLKENERRINYKELICKDGSETTESLLTLKNDIDLAVVGKHHHPEIDTLFGLEGEWSEYPEVGVLADLLLTPDYNFSLLVVQQEPPHDQPIFDDTLNF